MATKTKNETIPLNTRVEMIRRFFADSKPANHPITEHPVSKQEEYVRELYLEMLCVMAQYENQNPENAFVLIKRILATCEKPQPLNEYIKRSMEITTERTAEFIRQCKSNHLCEIFMIDSMLLSCSQGTPNEKQVAFLTQFGEMLGFKKNNLLEISKFSVSILEQNSNAYQGCLSDSNITVQEAALCYAKQFVSGKIFETSTRVVFYAVQRTDIPFLKEDISIENKDHVEFENLTFINTTVTLSSIKCVLFRNCTFRDYKNKSTINATIVDEFNITGCVFSDCTRKDEHRNCGMICLDRIGKVNLKSSIFTNCNLSESANTWKIGLIYIEGIDETGRLLNETEMLIDRCEFRTVNVLNECSKSLSRVIVYARQSISVTNCTFFDCQGNGLFWNVSEEENNKLTNCSPFKASGSFW